MLLSHYAYYMMELIEEHTYHAYDTYLKTYGEELKTQPAPEVAITYYRDGDLYMFDEFQTATRLKFRCPKVDNLYDVFTNIRDDEGEHVKTMIACQNPETRRTFESPNGARFSTTAVKEAG